jgi:hypothetical protein
VAAADDTELLDEELAGVPVGEVDQSSARAVAKHLALAAAPPANRGAADCLAAPVPANPLGPQVSPLVPLAGPLVEPAERAHVYGPAERLGSPAPGGAELLSRQGVRQRVQGPGEAREVLGIVDDQARLAEPTRGSVGATRHHRESRRRCLQTDVREGVVAGRQEQCVGGGVDVLQILALAEKADAVPDAELVGQPSPGSRSVRAGHPQHCVGGAAPGERAEGGVEALAVESASGQEPHGTRTVAHRLADPLSHRLPPAGMEAFQIHAVADHDDAAHGKLVARDQFVPNHLRVALDDLAGVAENTALDGEQRRVPGREPRLPKAGAGIDPLHVVGVAAAPGTIDILVSGPREGVHDVEASPRRGAGRSV